MIYPQNPPGTSKNQPETLKNRENPLGTIKNNPGTLKNQKKPSETMNNQPETLKNHKKNIFGTKKTNLGPRKTIKYILAP